MLDGELDRALALAEQLRATAAPAWSTSSTRTERCARARLDILTARVALLRANLRLRRATGE